MGRERERETGQQMEIKAAGNKVHFMRPFEY